MYARVFVLRFVRLLLMIGILFPSGVATVARGQEPPAMPKAASIPAPSSFSQAVYLPLLINSGHPNVAPPTPADQWQTYRDPLYHYSLTVPATWHVSPPSPDAIYGAAVLLNYDTENLNADVMPPGSLKIQIGVAPLTSGQTLQDWSSHWQAQQFALSMHDGFGMQVSAASTEQVGAYDAVAYDLHDGAHAVVREMDVALDDRQVMVVNVTPADSALLPLVKQIIGGVQYDAALAFRPEVLSIASELAQKMPIAATAFNPAATTGTCVDGTFPGSEATNSPLPIHMPFKGGETWTVGGYGSFYGNGYHCNSNNDYYATDWNRWQDAGAAVLPVADGTVISAVTPTCPGTGYGCNVRVDHGSGVRTQYSHLNSVLRTSGSVSHTDQIGTVGTTGNSTAEHLHFSFWVNSGGYYYSHCFNNGGACPNGEGATSPQSPRPSPMNTANGAQILVDGGTYTSDNGGSGTGPDPTAPDAGIEPNNIPGQATALAYNQTVQAAISPIGDADYYAFQGAAGDKVVVDIDARVNSSPLDSFLTLYDADGQTVLATHDDESAQLLDSHLGYTLGHAGVYYVRVTDYHHGTAGGSNYTYSLHILTDAISPDPVAITFPVADGWLNRAKPAVIASVADNQSGVQKVEFYWRARNEATAEWQSMGVDKVAADGWSWDISGLGEAAGLAFYAKAYDWAGNHGEAEVRSAGIDCTRPASSVSSLPALSDPTFLVAWAGTDNLSSVAKYDVQYRLGETGAWTTWKNSLTVTTASFTGLPDTVYQFRSRAYDVAGNVEAWPANNAADASTQTQAGPADVIFKDGFEACNLAAWSANSTDGGDLNAAPAAAMVGACGMQAVIDDNTPIYVTDDRPNSEARYRTQFYFNPNSVVMANGDTHTIALGYQGTATTVWRLDLRFYAGSYQLQVALHADGSVWKGSAAQKISNAPHLIEIDWQAATAAEANDGAMTLWIDEVAKVNLTGIDNDTRRIGSVRIGAVANLDPGTRGAYFFDQFVSRRELNSGSTKSASIEQMTLLDINGEGEATRAALFLPLITR